jgi:hypothetical protein
MTEVDLVIEVQAEGASESSHRLESSCVVIENTLKPGGRSCSTYKRRRELQGKAFQKGVSTLSSSNENQGPPSPGEST